jgi:hypothetical protein
MIEELKVLRGKQEYISPLSIASIYVGLGEKDEAAFKPLPRRLVGEWKPGPSPVELSKRKFSAEELRIMLDHDSP